jgi:alkanesulfonate monooxygenase SsuD/methylene tetrahydromethanopterin reductase-like flavin-dependent oxidoreductase (luciferase family)
MKIGYFAIGLGPLTNPDWVRTVASNAERLGFSTIWAPEHVVLLDRFASKYPYSSGDFPVPTDTPISDPFTTIAFAGGMHETDPSRHWDMPRPRAQPTRPRQDGQRRAQRTRETIDVMRKLWSEDRSSYDGAFVKFDSVGSFPKPANGVPPTEREMVQRLEQMARDFVEPAAKL